MFVCERDGVEKWRRVSERRGERGGGEGEGEREREIKLALLLTCF